MSGAPGIRGCADLAQPVSVEGVGEKHADAYEDEERCHDLDHGFPPCVAIPESARFRNSR